MTSLTDAIATACPSLTQADVEHIARAAAYCIANSLDYKSTQLWEEYQDGGSSVAADDSMGFDTAADFVRALIDREEAEA